MNVIIHELRLDHHNFSRVLSFMRSTANSAGQQESGDQNEALRQAVAYMRTFPREVHHPKEDLIFDIFVHSNSIISKSSLDKLRTEHAELESKIEKIASITQSQDNLADSAQCIEQYYRHHIDHMRFEEVAIYPMVETSLTISDWKHILKQSPIMPDPVFGAETDHRFEVLRDGILEFESRKHTTVVPTL